MSTSVQARRWCFTDFSLKEDKWTELYFADTFSFLIIGRETCPKTGRSHLQGYFEVSKKKTLSGLLKLIDWGPHLEIAKGDWKQNEVYCSKENDYTKYGEPMKQGLSGKLKDVIVELKAGKTNLESIMDDDPAFYHQYKHTLKDAQAMRSRARTEKPTVHWYFGSAGTGKTRLAYELAMKTYSYDEIFWYTSNDNEFWDGYIGQRCVILDDFRASQMKYAELLKKLDRYPNKCKIKGRSPVEFRADMVIITSCHSPYDVYKGQISHGDGIDQLIRRIDKLECLDKEEIKIEVEDAKWVDADDNIILED